MGRFCLKRFSLAAKPEKHPDIESNCQMQWTLEAEKAIKKIPFFVRKKVSARVEKEAKEMGKNRITLAEVRTTQAKYLSNMTSEIKGYQIDICFGPGGCPNRSNQLIEGFS